MAQECNNQEAREAYSTKGNSFKVPITNVRIISKIFNALINLPNLPKPPIPRGLIAIGNTFRPGINSASMTAKILQKISQDRIPIGPLPSGGENLVSKFVVDIAEGVVEEIITKGHVVVENTDTITLPVIVTTSSGTGTGTATIPPGTRFEGAMA